MVSAYRLEVVRTKLREPTLPINSSADAARRYSYLARYDRERLIRLDLDSQNRVLGEEIISIGTVNSTLVSPREVFKGAILNNATRIILVHNHPGGCSEPSSEDEQISEQLRDGGKLLGIPVIDFVIIGENGRYWSSASGEGRVDRMAAVTSRGHRSGTAARRQTAAAHVSQGNRPQPASAGHL